MFNNSVSLYIAIIISTKSCVTSLEFPTLHFNSMLSNLSSSIVEKPIQTFYQAPISAFGLLQRANPLNYLVPSSNSYVSGEQNTPYSINYTISSLDKDRDQTKSLEAPFLYNKPNNKVLLQDHLGRKTKVTPAFSSHRRTMPSYGYMELLPQNASTVFDDFMQVMEQLESKFYQVSFQKLLSISPPERRENGISFAQSGLFLYLQLIALCNESEAVIVEEIKQSLGLKSTCAEQVQLLKSMLSTLPVSSDFLKFRWSSRLVTGPQLKISEKFSQHTAQELHVKLDHLDKTNDLEELAKRLNQMVEADSGGAMHDTFEAEELSNGVCAVWLSTIYLRARWRSAPTALNGSWLFYDGTAPARSVRMIRINDLMQYVHLDDWDAEALEIRYATPDLTLMILMPRGRSLWNLTRRISAENLHKIYEKMHTRRVAVVLPIYTLRMTLLLPGKLKMMGISRLFESQTDTDCESLKLSHSVQRIMFWAEAGRNAYKDDGIEWDEAPELERVVDRPYIFFVRWRNITLLNGNFVL